MSISPFSSTINIKSARPVLKSPNKQLRTTVGSKVLQNLLFCDVCAFWEMLGSLRLGSVTARGGLSSFQDSKSHRAVLQSGYNRCVYFIYRRLFDTATVFNFLHLRSKPYLPVSSQNLTNN